MATITWPRENIHKRDELEDKIIAAYACAASVVEQTRKMHVEHARSATVVKTSPNSVCVSITSTNMRCQLVDVCTIYFDYCTESNHWYLGRGVELMAVADQISDRLGNDEYEWDTYGEVVLTAIGRLYHKIAVDIESKY